MDNLEIISLREKDVVDITDKVNSYLASLGRSNGICFINVLHTTCSLTTMNMDSETDMDLLDAVQKMFPPGEYRHPHNPSHVGDHIMSALIGSSITLPYVENKLILGTWQRVILIDLNGPRKRKVRLSVI